MAVRSRTGCPCSTGSAPPWNPSSSISTCNRGNCGGGGGERKGGSAYFIPFDETREERDKERERQWDKETLHLCLFTPSAFSLCSRVTRTSKDEFAQTERFLCLFFRLLFGLICVKNLNRTCAALVSSAIVCREGRGHLGVFVGPLGGHRERVSVVRVCMCVSD